MLPVQPEAAVTLRTITFPEVAVDLVPKLTPQLVGIVAPYDAAKQPTEASVVY